MQLEIIGTVHSCFKEKFGTPRQGALAKASQGYIELSKIWKPEQCLKGLEGFSHIWVVFAFHENSNLSYRPIIHPPRHPSLKVGCLASRSPLRPNPIGLSLVKLDRIESPRLYVSGLDMIDGTPVLDIKPYIHAYDSVENSLGGWTQELSDLPSPIEFSEEAMTQIQAHANPQLKSLISDILSSDIRNKNDKNPKNYGKRLGFYYDDLNIVFEVHPSSTKVLRVESRKSLV